MRSWLRANLSMIVLVTTCCLVVAIAVLFAMVLPLVSQVSTQAVAGQHARTIQCAVAPIGRKLYADAMRRGVLSHADLDTYQRVVLFTCPSPGHPVSR